MSKFVSLYSLPGGVHKPGRSRRGSMREKGGPENAFCSYKGLRQRGWGKRVSEIREHDGGARKWLGTFKDSVSSAMAYDKAAIEIFGPDAMVNFPDRLSQVARPNHDANPDQVTVADQVGKGNQVSTDVAAGEINSEVDIEIPEVPYEYAGIETALDRIDSRLNDLGPEPVPYGRALEGIDGWFNDPAPFGIDEIDSWLNDLGPDGI